MDRIKQKLVNKKLRHVEITVIKLQLEFHYNATIAILIMI